MENNKGIYGSSVREGLTRALNLRNSIILRKITKTIYEKKAIARRHTGQTVNVAVILCTIVACLSQFNDSAAINTKSSVVQESNYILSNVANESHSVGTKENEKVKDFIVGYFEDLGIEVYTQSHDIKKIHAPYRLNPEVTGQLNNIIAVIPGIRETNSIVITAHYDSVPQGPGAGDDGYGVVAVLQAAKYLSQKKQIDNTVYFIISDGEEEGLLGASALINNKEIFNSSTLVVNFDARGNKGVPMMYETAENDYELMRMVRRTVDNLVAYSLGNDIYKFIPNWTDYTIYKEKNIQGCNFATLMGMDAYHNMNDSFENANQYTMEEYVNYATRLTARLAYLSSSRLNEILNCKTNGVYFTIAKNHTIVYSEYVAYAMFIFSILCAGFSIYYFKKHKNVSFKKMLKGFGVILLNTVLVSALGYLLVRVFYFIKHYEVLYGVYVFEYRWSKYVMVALLIMAAFIHIALAGKLARKYGTNNICFGILFLQTFLGVVLFVLLGGSSYLFVIPAVCKYISFIPKLYNMKWNRLMHYIFIVLWIVPDILVMGPAMYLLFHLYTVGVAPVIILVASFLIEYAIFSSIYSCGQLKSKPAA